MGKDHDVGGDRLRVEARLRPALGHRARQAASPLVILGQSIETPAHGHQTGRRNHAGLPHGAAQPLALDARPPP